MKKKSNNGGEGSKIKDLRNRLKVYNNPEFENDIINITKEYTSRTEDFNTIDIWEIVKGEYDLSGKEGEKALRDILWTWRHGPM